MMRLCLLLVLAGGPLCAQEPTLEEARLLLEELQERDRRKGFEYQAEHFVVYGQGGDSILLLGRATVLHKEARLEAAEMVYRRAREEVEARAAVDSAGNLVGEPVLKRGDEVLRGERILYDLNSQRGTIVQGRIHRDKGYYQGALIQTRSAEEFHVHRGSYTTCDRPAPHFDFYSPRIKVLVDEMAIARPVYFRVKERPVLWIPFCVFSLRQDRQSGILTPGFGRRPLSFGSALSEWEVRNLGYYFAPNEYWDLTLSSDLRQRSGWLGRLQLNYALRYRFSGRLDAQLENRQSGAQAQRNWRLDLSHNQELGPFSSLRASGAFQSNRSFSRDNSLSLQDRLNRTLRSNFSYSRRWRASGNSLSLTASQSRNLDTQNFDRVLPEISLRKGRQPLWGEQERAEAQRPWYGRIYYDGSARLRNEQRGTSADTTVRTSADLGLRATAQYRPFSWLNLSPSLSEDWRDQDLRSGQRRGVRTDRLGGSASLTQTLYGLFYPNVWRLTALRHVLKPSLSLSFQAARADTGGVLGIGGDGRPWEQSRRLDVRLDNTFWAKIQRGEEEDKVRLAQLNFSTAYDFENKQRPLADLATSLSVEAGRYLDSRLSLRSEFYDQEDRLGWPRLRQFEVRSGARWARRATGAPEQEEREQEEELESGAAYGREGFGFESGLRRDIERRGYGPSFQVAHYYARTRQLASTSTRSWARLSASFSLGRQWHLDYSLNYDLHHPAALFSTARITSELFSIQRQFHDWTATLNVEPSRFGENRAFYFKAQFKDIPQIRFERGDGRF
jgi:predicted DNA-binding ribbon-helix-helix protein